MSGGHKILLAWDIDDVLNQFMLCCLPHFPSKRAFTYEELTVNPPYELLGIGKEQYLKVLDECRAELYKMPPRPEIVEFFERHGGVFNHVAISAVPLRFAPFSAQWVLHHFGKWMQNFIFIPSPRTGVKMESQQFSTKAEAIASFKEEAVLIDDSPTNVADARRNACNAMLFPAPWNESRNQNIEDFLNQLLELKEKC